MYALFVGQIPLHHFSSNVLKRLWNTRVESYRDRNKKKAEHKEILQLLRDEVPGLDVAILKG